MFLQSTLARSLAVIFGGSALALSVIPEAAAQEQQPAQQQLERITVTGSNIKRTDAEGVAPVQVITREQIERSGQSTVAELIRSISANSGNSYNETFTNSFSPGASGVSLRGLSQKNTLVLLNGHRVANYGFAQNLQDTYVDLNSIPSNAVERIDVLKDGASAVYGSDAIAGVVNVILRSDYRGAIIGASTGRSWDGGLGETDVNGTFGFGDLAVDRYNVMVSANLFKRNALAASQRDYIKSGDFRDKPDGTLYWSSGATYRTSPRQPFPTCGTAIPGVVIPGSELSTSGTVCAYNLEDYLTLVPESERGQLVASGKLQISADTTAYADVVYSHNKTTQSFTPAAWSPTSVAYDPATGGVRIIPSTLPASNPSNPFGAPVNINYTFFAVGPRSSEIKTDFYRAMAGLKGTAGSWDWDVSYLHSESETKQIAQNRVNAYLLEQFAADGSFNFLDPYSTPDQLNQLRINPTRKSTSKMDSAAATFSTELAQMSAGPLGFATGLEYRKESINDQPDALLTSGAVLGQGSTATKGQRENWAYYGELQVPIAKSLEAQLAGRYDQYSDFGSAFSPKAGLRWQPTQEVLVRTSISRGFRAPSLPEISNSSATFFTTVADPKRPCVPPSTNPAQPYCPGNVSTAGVFQSNADLKPELSTSFNFGMVFSPTNDLSFGFDFYKIKQTNIITSTGFNYILKNDTLFPGQVLRDAEGNLVAVYDKYRNLSQLLTSGVDVDYEYKIPTKGLGKFTIDGTWSYMSYYKQPESQGGELIDYAGSNGLSAFPRIRGTTGLAWDYGSWGSKLNLNYTHRYAQTYGGDQTEVASHTTYDVYAEYKGFKNLRIYGSILNILNSKPPYDAYFANSYGLPYDFTLYDSRDRYVRIGAEYKF